MAMMAGLLGVRLAKEGHYALGDADEALSSKHITEAWKLASRASLLALVSVVAPSVAFTAVIHG